MAPGPDRGPRGRWARDPLAGHYVRKRSCRVVQGFGGKEKPPCELPIAARRPQTPVFPACGAVRCCRAGGGRAFSHGALHPPRAQRRLPGAAGAPHVVWDPQARNSHAVVSGRTTENPGAWQNQMQNLSARTLERVSQGTEDGDRKHPPPRMSSESGKQCEEQHRGRRGCSQGQCPGAAHARTLRCAAEGQGAVPGATHARPARGRAWASGTHKPRHPGKQWFPWGRTQTGWRGSRPVTRLRASCFKGIYRCHSHKTGENIILFRERLS